MLITEMNTPMTMNSFLKTSAKVVLYALSIAALVVGIEGEPVLIVIGLLGMGIWLALTMFNLDFSKLDFCRVASAKTDLT